MESECGDSSLMPRSTLMALMASIFVVVVVVVVVGNCRHHNQIRKNWNLNLNLRPVRLEMGFFFNIFDYYYHSNPSSSFSGV